MSTRLDELVHIWNQCYACGAAPIVGVRFSCLTCPAGADNDLCEACYKKYTQGLVEHPSPGAREAPAGPHRFRAFEGIEHRQILPWLTIPCEPAPPPHVPDRFVVRPEFQSERESFFGSYAFVVAAEDGGQPVVITALHVLDELAKFRDIDCSDNNTSYTGRELPRYVTSVQLYDPFASNWMLSKLGTAGNMLFLPHARICSNEPYSQHDIAAFRVAPPSPFRPLPLAVTQPKAGDPIWLAVNLGRDVRERAAQAVVVENNHQTFVFRFSASARFPLHSSGAPLLNQAGEIVGINVGGGTIDGNKLGHATHSMSMRRHLGW